MSKIINVLKCKCPNCEDGSIFNNLGNLLLLKSPKMNSICKVCNFKFEKEPSFFFGAMFVSYVLIAAELIASVILFKFLLAFSYLNVLFIALTITIFLSTFNLRVSRSIWIYMFYNDEL